MNKLILLAILMIVLPIILFSGEIKQNKSILKETALGFSKVIDMDFDSTLIKVKAELKKEGFGVLTEVDVQATMKKKLNVEFRPYQILGVCNPPLAHKALFAEEQIGLMLPCKFIVYVNKDSETVVAAVDPAKMMSGIDKEQLSEIAQIVQAKFKKVLSSI